MDVHVLNGDALAEKFPLSGKIIVCREVMIDGPVDAIGAREFFDERAEFIFDTFEAEKATYFTRVKNEFDRLANVHHSSPIHLWFEHDLFCQANLWFLIHFIRENRLPNPVFVVLPPTDVTNIWSGFGWMTSDDLLKCFSEKVRLSDHDITFGSSLWDAYRSNNFHKLEQCCLQPSDAFPMLKEVCKAHMDRFSSNGLGRPQQKLKSIIDSGTKDFDHIFEEFWKTESIYGFGDLQVKKMLRDL